MNAARVETVAELDAALTPVNPGDIVSLRVYNPNITRSRVERVRTMR